MSVMNSLWPVSSIEENPYTEDSQEYCMWELGVAAAWEDECVLRRSSQNA